MLFLMLYILAFVAFQHLFRYTQLKGEQPFPIFTANYIVAGIAAVVWSFVVLGTTTFQIGLVVMIAGVFTGLFFISQLWTIIDSYRFAGVGITVAVAASSLVIPSFYGWLVFEESLNTWGWLGMALVLPAVALLRPRDHTSQVKVGLRENASLIACFILGGGIGIAHKTATFNLREPEHFIGYITVAYLTAGIVGAAALLVTRQRMTLRTLRLGIPIGACNIFSLACLMLALATIPVIIAYPIQGSLTIVLGMLAGMVLWKEKPMPRQWLGLLLAIVSVALISAQPNDKPSATNETLLPAPQPEPKPGAATR